MRDELRQCRHIRVTACLHPCVGILVLLTTTSIITTYIHALYRVLYGAQSHNCMHSSNSKSKLGRTHNILVPAHLRRINSREKQSELSTVAPAEIPRNAYVDYNVRRISSVSDRYSGHLDQITYRAIGS